MKALFVYPEFPETYWSFHYALAADLAWADLVFASAMLVQIGWRGMVFIVDDNFIGNKRNVKQLLPELAAWSERHHQPFSFITEASVNLAEDDELVEGMRRTGFRRVFLGIETPVAESLKENQKYQNTRHHLLDSVHKIQRYGMEVMAGFILSNNFAHDLQSPTNFISAHWLLGEGTYGYARATKYKFTRRCTVTLACNLNPRRA